MAAPIETCDGGDDGARGDDGGGGGARGEEDGGGDANSDGAAGRTATTVMRRDDHDHRSGCDTDHDGRDLRLLGPC